MKLVVTFCLILIGSWFIGYGAVKLSWYGIDGFVEQYTRQIQVGDIFINKRSDPWSDMNTIKIVDTQPDWVRYEYPSHPGIRYSMSTDLLYALYRRGTHDR